MFILDLKNYACMTLKLSLPRFMKTVPDKCRLLHSLQNRSRNKPTYLKFLKDSLIQEHLSLIDVSKVFMRINSIYKQASIERQSLKKRTIRDNKPILDSKLMQGPQIERLFLQQQRLSRLRPNNALA